MRGVSARLVATVASVVTIAAVGGVSTMQGADSKTAARPPEPPRRTTLAKPTFVADETRWETCKRRDGACLQQAWGNLAHEHGSQDAINRLEAALQANDVSAAACHMVVHGIGEAAYAREPSSVPKLIATGTQMCSAGYYHGVLSEAFRGVATPDVPPLARAICADESLQGTDGLRNSCGHGIGHGLMAQGGRDIRRALRACDELEQRDQSWCYSGAFMEHFSETPTRDAPGPETCKDLGPRYDYDCYVGSVDGLRANHGQDWEAIARTCDRLDPAWIDTCHLGLGRHVGTFYNERPARIRTACDASRSRARICMVHAASQAVGVLLRIGPALAVCPSLRGEDAAQCWRMSGGVLFGNGGVRAARAGCAQAPAAMRRPCLEPSIPSPTTP